MAKVSLFLPDSISIEDMMQVKGGITEPPTTAEPEEKIVIECKPGPAVSCYPGSAV